MKRAWLWLLLACCSTPLWGQVQNVPFTVTYVCSGGYGPYSFTFPISDPTSMTVTLNGTSVPSTGYTIIPLNNNYINGGMVTLGASYPCTTGNLVLTRSTQITQLTVFYDNMPSLPGITGNAVNKLTEIAQELEGMFSTGGAVTSIQMQNAGVNYLTPAGGAITFNFQGCIVSGSLGTFTISCSGGGSGANYTLSNLVAPTAVNVPLLPGTAGLGLGSSTLPWNPNIGNAAGETLSFNTSAQTANRVASTQDAPMTLPTTAQEAQLPSTAPTGIMRGGAPMTASELSGFSTTSGSNVVSPGSVASGKTLTIASGGSLICASGSTCPGSGTVNSGTATHLAYYASTGTGVSDMGADFTFSTHTLAGGASAIFDLHSASSFLLPGALSTGLARVTTSTGAVSSAELSGFATTSGSNVVSPGTVASGKTLTIASGGTLTCVSGSTCPTGGGTPVYKAETGSYQVLATDFSTPAPACGVINYTSNSSTVTLVASTSQPAAGQCVEIYNVGAQYITVAASGQTLTYGNVTSASYPLILNTGSGVRVVSDGTNYWGQIISAPGGGTAGNTVYGGSSSAGASTVRSVIIGSNVANSTFTGYNNTLIGSTMAGSLTSGVSNVGIGYNNLGSLTSGGYNIGIGYGVGDSNMASGSYNLIFGFDGSHFCDTPSGSTSNYLCINNLIYGTTGSAGGKVGIEGPIPTIASNACGSSTQGTLATGSSDTAGEVTVGTTGVTSCAVSFANSWTNAPFCVVSEQTSLATVTGFAHTISTSTLTVTATAGFSGTKFDYICLAGSNSANPAP